MLGLSEKCSWSIGLADERGSGGAAANDCRLGSETTKKFEEAFRMSEGSQTDHQTLPRLLGWLAVKFPV